MPQAGSWAWAAEALEEGVYVRRNAWPEGQWVKLEREDQNVESCDLVMFRPPEFANHAGRTMWTPGWPALSAKDWVASGRPTLKLPYSHAELTMQAETARVVYFRPPLDRLQQEHFIAADCEPPDGWVYKQVYLAIRRKTDEE